MTNFFTYCYVHFPRSPERAKLAITINLVFADKARLESVEMCPQTDTNHVPPKINLSYCIASHSAIKFHMG
jgi:hypothetical protein